MSDTELLNEVESREWSVEFTGADELSWRVLTGYTVRGPVHVYGYTLRGAIEEALITPFPRAEPHP